MARYMWHMDNAFTGLILIQFLEYSYNFPPTAPSFDDPSIVWEQSIVEGHPTHPVRSQISSKILP